MKSVLKHYIGLIFEKALQADFNFENKNEIDSAIDQFKKEIKEETKQELKEELDLDNN